MNMFCHNCGRKQPENAKFCHNCGSKGIALRGNPSGTVSVSSKIFKKFGSQHNLLDKKVLPYLLPVLILVIIAIVWSSSKILSQPVKSDESNTTSTLLAVKSDSVFSPSEAEKIVSKYFNLLDRKDYEQAFDLFSSSAKNDKKIDDWKDGYKNTLSHVVNSITCEDFVCNVDLTATESVNKNIQRVNYKFKYYVVFDPEKNLKIDKTVFVSQGTPEVLKFLGSDSNSDSSLLSSFVKVLCTEPSLETFSQGSGTIIGDDIVLTNFHVSLGYPTFCIVKRVNSNGVITDDDYDVDYSIVENSDYDFWTFHIVKDSKNINENPQPLPLKVCSESQIKIGDSVRVYGFPAASGGNLTITEGLISGRDQRLEGLYITSAKIDHGNSGGAAINTSKDCFFGVPTVALQGDFENYGGIESLNTIMEIQPNLFSLTTPSLNKAISKKVSPSPTPKVKISPSVDDNTDSDADGLTDTDETVVWGTDPFNPDTDGDTYSDGAEVKTGFSPKGPGKLFEVQP